jgi:hypothetical protein
MEIKYHQHCVSILKMDAMTGLGGKATISATQFGLNFEGPDR